MRKSERKKGGLEELCKMKGNEKKMNRNEFNGVLELIFQKKRLNVKGMEIMF